LQRLAFADELAPDVDIGGIRTHGEARDQRTLDQRVRIVAHDFAVLTGRRFGFIGVDDQIRGTAVRLFGHKGPFHPGREARAAATAQTRGLDLINDLVTPAGDDGGGAVPAAALFRAGKAAVAHAIDIRKDPVLIVQHRLILIPARTHCAAARSARSPKATRSMPQSPQDRRERRISRASPYDRPTIAPPATAPWSRRSPPRPDASAGHPPQRHRAPATSDVLFGAPSTGLALIDAARVFGLTPRRQKSRLTNPVVSLDPPAHTAQPLGISGNPGLVPTGDLLIAGHAIGVQPVRKFGPDTLDPTQIIAALVTRDHRCCRFIDRVKHLLRNPLPRQGTGDDWYLRAGIIGLWAK